MKRLKASCTKEEWIKYREKLLLSSTTKEIRYDLLESEGLYKELLNEILAKGEVTILNRYETVLQTKYPQKICSGYINYVLRQADRVCDRNGYRELMKYLKKIATYSVGKKKAFEIATAWKTKYRRRPAMMDELRKSGF